jgi:GNAT superfamily N-acetyltransferase
MSTKPARGSAVLAAACDLRVAHAESDDQIRACFPVMRELRPHLAGAEAFLAQVRRQESERYRILALWRGAAPVACAGYRLGENLIHGRYLYVDDLVTLGAERSHGHGDRLIEVLRQEARARDCRTLVLDSGVDNTRAHRFYFREGLRISGFHFRMPVG